MKLHADTVVGLARHGLDLAKGAYPARWTAPVASEARWSRERAQAWWDEVGWLAGCNFTPSTASNQLELWQAETYDPETIDRELGWAADLGFNSIRLFLHHLLVDAPGFHDRLDEVLGIAASHGIGALLVLFDGCWNPEARLGPQPAPRPGIHNSTWVQSPGTEILADPRRWSELRPYVVDTITRFAHDPRVHGWDLFNEPNPTSAYYPRTDARDKYRLARELLAQVFDWAQAVDPDQPLTAGVFLGTGGALERGDPINRLMLGRSDVISFHSYFGRRRLAATIDHLAAYGRPMLCTEWLGRPRSPAELIEVFAGRDVAAYNWGLVDGRTQTKYPWTSWQRRTRADAPWFHELFHPDGTPYDQAEVDLIRATCVPRTRRVTDGQPG